MRRTYLAVMFKNTRNSLLVKKPFIIQTRKKVCEKFLKYLWRKGLFVGYTTNMTRLNTSKQMQVKILVKYPRRKARHHFEFVKWPAKPRGRRKKDLVYFIEQIRKNGHLNRRPLHFNYWDGGKMNWYPYKFFFTKQALLGVR